MTSFISTDTNGCVICSDAAATANLAATMAHHLQGQETLLLQGPVGAGKSHFARSLIQFLMAKTGAVEPVPSPSFTLMQSYRAGGLEICHADLYRLGDISELDELGLHQMFGQMLCLVEWPERLGEDAPTSALTMQFQIDASDTTGNTRTICAKGNLALWHATLSDGSL